MLEEDLRTLFRLQSEGDMPASSVSVPAAGLRARTARRRRRVVMIGSPLLAAAAVLAVVASLTLLGTGTGGTPEPSTPGPQHLDPTRSYASFGCLPGAVTSENGGTSRTEMWLNANAGRLAVSLAVYSAGQCRLQPPAAGHRAQLSCAGGVGNTGESAAVAGEADVRGHQAYIVTVGTGVLPVHSSAHGRAGKQRASAKDHFLAWQYARSSWAVLEYFAQRRTVALRIADHARVGVVTGAIRFPAQITGVPPAWRVADVAFSVRAGVLAAGLYQLTVGPRNLAPAGAGYPVDMPGIAIGPPQAAQYCTLQGVPVRHQVINRYHVLVQDSASVRDPAQSQEQLCAPRADGLSVAMYVVGSHPVLNVATIFSHMRLLGPDPSHWTTHPLG